MFIETRHTQTAIANGTSHIATVLTSDPDTLFWSLESKLVENQECDTRPVASPEYFRNIKGPGGSSMLH